MPHTHASPYAGHWYSASPSELSEQIAGLFADSARRHPFVRAGGLAFVAPHAAPAYSGGVAATVYRHVQAAHPRRVVMLGFCHRGGVAGIGVPNIHSIATPLGTTRIDVDGAAELTACIPFHFVAEESVCDHSIEIQLPFLTTVAPRATLLPLYVGHLSRSERFAAASRLRELAEPGTVFVASSDFTHYGRDFGYMPFPLDESTPQRLEELDREMMNSSSGIDPGMFLSDVRRTQCTVCGSEPIALLLEILRGIEGDEIFQETLEYQTSGGITSDYSHCVSYAGLGYFPEQAFRLSREAQERLIGITRETLQADALPEFDDLAPAPELEQHRGLFVTLSQHGELRGCIGSCRDPETLIRAAPRLTLCAAHEDRRFDAIDETEPVDLQISLLSPFKRIQSKSDLVAGDHGGYLEFDGHSGLLLPQVAKEHHLDTPRFLEALARKAGAPARAYDDPACRLYVFRAQVFGSRRMATA